MGVRSIKHDKEHDSTVEYEIQRAKVAPKDASMSGLRRDPKLPAEIV